MTLVHAYAAPSWLPRGGRAEVHAARGESVPEPMCIVRLLITDGDRVLVTPRADGHGLDIPSRIVGAEGTSATVDTLARSFGAVGDPRPVGFVRNVVIEPSADYPWPSPYAHFGVWTVDCPESPRAPSRWLGEHEAYAELGARHWWPLAARII